MPNMDAVLSMIKQLMIGGGNPQAGLPSAGGFPTTPGINPNAPYPGAPQTGMPSGGGMPGGGIPPMPQAQQQGGGLLPLLAQIGMSFGKYGGYRGQGMSDQMNRNRTLQMQQQQQANDWYVQQQRMQQEGRQAELANQREERMVKQYESLESDRKAEREAEKARQKLAEEREARATVTGALNDLTKFVTDNNIDTTNEQSMVNVASEIARARGLNEQQTKDLIRASSRMSQLKRVPPKQAASEKPRQVDVNHRGKHVFANYVDGKYYHPATGADITSEVTPYDKPPSETSELNPIMRLRTRYQTEMSDDITRFKSYQFIKESIKDESGFSDIDLVYNWIKMKDPNAVREGELSLAKSGDIGMLRKLEQLGNVTFKGRVLTPTQRQKLLENAESNFRVIKKRWEKKNDDFKRISKASGVDSESVISEIPSDESPTTGAATPGGIKVKTPDGQIWIVSKDKLEEAKRRGAVEVP